MDAAVLNSVFVLVLHWKRWLCQHGCYSRNSVFKQLVSVAVAVKQWLRQCGSYAENSECASMDAAVKQVYLSYALLNSDCFNVDAAFWCKIDVFMLKEGQPEGADNSSLLALTLKVKLEMYWDQLAEF